MSKHLLALAVAETKNLKSGEKFIVKDLFKGYEWNRFAKSDRLGLGTLFINEVTSDPSLGISVLSKTTSNQQQYQKTPPWTNEM